MRGPSLEESLAELERTDPVVAALAAKLEKVKREILAKPMPIRPLGLHADDDRPTIRDLGDYGGDRGRRA
jgi:hypothetical protein